MVLACWAAVNRRLICAYLGCLAELSGTLEHVPGVQPFTVSLAGEPNAELLRIQLHDLSRRVAKCGQYGRVGYPGHDRRGISYGVPFSCQDTPASAVFPLGHGQRCPGTAAATGYGAAQTFAGCQRGYVP